LRTSSNVIRLAASSICSVEIDLSNNLRPQTSPAEHSDETSPDAVEFFDLTLDGIKRIYCMASWVLVTSPIISLSAPCFCNQSVVLNPQAMYKLMVRSCELTELRDPPSLCCNPLTRVATPDPASCVET
jgi:hypothetical protein